MILATIISYLPYALITTFTPGPNNLISFYAVSNHGWKKGSKVLAGIGTAIFLIMLITALFCHQLASHIEASFHVLKWLGAAYIIYLAVQIARDKPNSTSFNISTFTKGFILVFINIKMILYALTVFGAYIISSTSEASVLILHALLLTALCVISNITWAMAGSILKNFISKHYRTFNMVMALILTYCAVSLILS